MIIKEFPTLYILDSKNKVRVFECKAVAGMSSGKSSLIPTDFDNYAVITATGLQGGKLIEKVELVKKGKQKRSVEEQAIFQATSLWTEKLDEGYKSKQMLTEALIKKNVANLYDETIITFAIRFLPEWPITNPNWDELPMLAHKYKDIKKPVYPYLAQPKLDGVRGIIKYKTNVVQIGSRGGQYYQIPHLLQQLTDLYHKIANLGTFKNFILDGEIYKHGVPLQEISGAARREESGMFASNSWLQYHIYDIIELGQNTRQDNRAENLRMLQTLITEYNALHIVPTTIVHDKNEMQQLHDEYVSRGYEGLILRCPDGKYEFNQRSKSLLKVKEYQDEEFQIIGCGYDENKSLGESFFFILKNNINDLTFKSRPTGTTDMKEYWYHNIEEVKGKRATVRFFARSNDGLPTQGVVRHKDTEVLVKHIRPDGE